MVRELPLQSAYLGLIPLSNHGEDFKKLFITSMLDAQHQTNSGKKKAGKINCGAPW